MNKLNLAFAALCLLLTFGSCDNDAEWADSESHEKEVEINNQYYEAIVGDWYRQDSTNVRKFYWGLHFNADGSMTSLMKFAKRDTVMVNGTPTLTDWRTVLNDSAGGSWSLKVRRIEENKGFAQYFYTFTDYPLLLPFSGIDGDTLRVEYLDIKYVVRGKKQPDF